jgi:hypothetical protein
MTVAVVLEQDVAFATVVTKRSWSPSLSMSANEAATLIRLRAPRPTPG